MFSVVGRVTIITGAAAGIGHALAKGFLEQGALVFGVDRRLEVGDSIFTSGSGRLFQCDIGDPESAAAVVQAAQETFGDVDILINNAGVNEIEPAETMPLETWNNTLDINLTGTFRLCQAAGRLMIEAKKGGSIINTASRCAYIGMPFGAAYNASKAGILALTRTLAVEWAPHGIRVNAIVPGVVRTPMNDHRDLDEDRLFESTIPLGRTSVAEDLIGPAVFLASKAASYITGEALIVDGGNYMANGIGTLYRDFKSNRHEALRR